MSGLRRDVSRVVCVAAAIAGCCVVGNPSAGAANSAVPGVPPAPRALDAVRAPAAIRARPLRALPAATSLIYNGGAVLNHGVQLHAVLWDPTGTSFPSGYGGSVSAYLSDIAAASGTSDNVFSVLTQYYDTPDSPPHNRKILWAYGGSPAEPFPYQILDGSFGSVAYRMTFAGLVTDSTAYPTNGCTDPGGRSTCLSEGQIRSETDAVANTHGWTPGFQNIVILITPPGVGSCGSAGCAGTDFCGYHTQGNSAPAQLFQIYVPDLGSPSCQSTDYVLTHELSETVTDPQGDAWFSGNGANGGEIGDLCQTQSVTETINGHSYTIEPNWSNADGACEGSYTNATDPPTLAGTIPGFAGLGHSRTYALSPQVNEGTLTGVSWNFGDGTTATGASVIHTYSSDNRPYLVSARATDSRDAFTGQAAAVTVFADPTVTVSPTPGPDGSTFPLGSNAPFLITGADPGLEPALDIDFGDGHSAEIAAPNGYGVVNHLYASLGTYTVTATITDVLTGVSAAASTQVQIVSPGAPAPPAGYPFPPTGGPPFVPPPAGPGTPVVHGAHVSGRTVAVTVSCAGTAGSSCLVRLTVKRGVVVASASVTLIAGQAETIRIGLNRAGMRLLAKRHTFTATLAAVQGGRTVFVSPVTFESKHRRGARRG